MLLWLLFQYGLSLGVSYGSFLGFYYYILKLYKDNPPKTVNGRTVLLEKWRESLSGLERLPFSLPKKTVLKAQFEVHPMLNRDNPVVINSSVVISESDVVRCGVFVLDQLVLWVALVCLGREMYTFMALQLINVLVFAALGFRDAFQDSVVTYSKLPIKKLE